MSSDPIAVPLDGRPSTKLGSEVWSVVVVVILGTTAVILDTTIINIALHSIARDLHDNLTDIQWVVTGYLLSIAVVIPLTGWVARRVGIRRVYLVSVGIFTLGSALCGLSTSAGELIVFRVVQGLGGGAIVPVGQMILVRAAGPHKLHRVMSAYSVPTMIAPLLGPTVGGLIVASAGWRWIFYVNVPIGVMAIAAGLRRLPREPAEPAGPFDVPGLGLVATGLVGVTYGLSQVGSGGHALLHVVLPIGAGILLVAAFVLRALRVERPLLDMRLYANKVFSAASVATFCLGGSLTVNSLLMPLYLQSVRHQDSLQAGLLVGPRGVGAAIGAWLSGRLMERAGTGSVATLGCAIIVVFTAPFMLLDSRSAYAFICIIQLLQGCGIGLAITPAQTAGYRALRRDQINDATPQQNILQRIGASIGTAILISILQSYLVRARGQLSGQVHAFDVTFGWLLVFSAVAMAASIVLLGMERRHAPSAFEGDLTEEGTRSGLAEAG